MNLCFQKRDHLLKVTEDQGLGTHLQTQERGSPYSKTEMKIELVSLAYAHIHSNRCHPRIVAALD